MRRKALSWLLIAAMLVSLLGISVFAAPITGSGAIASFEVSGRDVTVTTGSSHTDNGVRVFTHASDVDFSTTGYGESITEATDNDDNGTMTTGHYQYSTANVNHDASHTFTGAIPTDATGVWTVAVWSETDGTATTTTVDFRTAATVELSATTATYTGSDLLPTVTVKAGTKTLVKDTDYTLAWSDGSGPVTSATNVGTYTATVTLLSTTDTADYKAPAPVTFTVTQAEAAASIPTAEVTYNGQDQLPTVAVKVGNTALTVTSDYTVSWSDGTSTVTSATDVGTYTGTATLTDTTNRKWATGKDTVTFKINQATPNATVTETKVTEAGKKLNEVVTTSAKGVDGNDLAGDWTWTKEDGTPIADITAEDVAEQATYKWTFTPDSTNYTTKTGSVTPWGESKATVTFEVDAAKGAIPADKATAEVKKNASFEASFPTVTAKEAYKFKGWAKKGTTDIVDVKTVTVADDTEFVAIFEDRARHEAIMLGRKDTTLFAPDDNLNRAEAATILSRLYGMYTDEEIFDETKGAAVQHAPTGFADVNDSAIWYYAAVGFAQNKNLIEGKSATSFAPAAKITRAEFVTMLARLVANAKDVPEVDVSQSKLTGISGHWAENAIVYLELNKGGLNGKVGTDFKPNDNLTRAEAAKMVNAVFGRVQSTSIKEEDQLDADLNLFTDVHRNTWYYNNVIEATVGHYADDSDFHTAG